MIKFIVFIAKILFSLIAFVGIIGFAIPLIVNSKIPLFLISIGLITNNLLLILIVYFIFKTTINYLKQTNEKN